MDSTSFDRLTRRLVALTSRRAALGGLIGAAALPAPRLDRVTSAKPKRKRRRRRLRQKQKQKELAAQGPRCPELVECEVQTGQRLQCCDFRNQDLRRREFGGSDLRGSSFLGANVCKADFGGTLLEDVDFSGLDLRGAYFQGAVITIEKFAGATFCDTTDPQGQKIFSNCSVGLGGVLLGEVCCDDSDCDLSPTCGSPQCVDRQCRSWGQCCMPVGTFVGGHDPSVCCSTIKDGNNVCVAA